MPGATYFVTFTLKNQSICDLTNDKIAPVVLNCLDFYAGKRFFLFDHTVMPDHVHLIIKPIEHEGKIELLGNVIGDVKKYSARQINGILNRSGPLWLQEYYDRLLRSDREFQKVARYIFENPIKAKLVDCGEDWKWWRQGRRP